MDLSMLLQCQTRTSKTPDQSRMGVTKNPIITHWSKTPINIKFDMFVILGLVEWLNW
jgi:hypothetical protein